MPSLIGTGPNQIPTNNLLGSLAFQDAENVKVESITYSEYLTGLGGFSVSNSSDISGWIESYGTDSSSSLVLSNGNGTSASNYSYIRFFNNKTAAQDWRVGTYNGDSFNIRDHTKAEFRFRIDTSGWSAFYMGGSTVYIGSGLVGDGTTNDSTIRWDATGALKICNYATTIAQFTNTGDLELKTTGYLKLPEGTTAQRPASPQEGMIRKNSTLGVIEGYSGGDYVSLEAGRLIARTVFTSDGTFTPNPKTKELVVELVGGGGGSGGVPATGASQASLSTAGGFGGYLKAQWPRSVPVAASYYVFVGVGGAGGSAGTNSGSAGVDSRFSDGVGSIATAKGGHGGGGGAVETVFPVIRKAGLTFSSSYVTGSFQEWDNLTPSRPSTIIYNSSGVATYADLTQPFVHRNDAGVGGDFKVSFASTAQAAGNTGKSGVVIIYEYS